MALAEVLVGSIFCDFVDDQAKYYVDNDYDQWVAPLIEETQAQTSYHSCDKPYYKYGHVELIEALCFPSVFQKMHACLF